MGSSGVFAKTILIPALIALTIYLLTTCLILPIFRRYHARYSQYLPLHNISAHTLSLRDRIADALMRFFLRSRGAHAHMGDHEDDNISIDDEEGEILVRMEMDAARREVLERRGGNGGSEGRLSRELEVGFMDDSEEEEGSRDGIR